MDAYQPLVPATLSFDASGTPYSQQYNDVYHARQGALDQAQHVFIRGCGLPARWQGRDHFTVCETGFGLGRNFLALWQAWRQDPRRSARLHVVAFEGHPFSAADMARANAEMPAPLGGLAAQLARAWPPLLPGVHRLEFEGGQLTLTLFFGPIEHTARQAQARVDAFFLDGFAPRVNPRMWSASLFGQLVRLAGTGATAATWCTAGQVRRDLRDAGFVVSKVPGLTGKREMTIASLREGLGQPVAASGRPGRVLVVGAGPAGAAIAHALALRGCAVTVMDPALAGGPAGMHAGHLAAAVTPVLSQTDDLRARLVRAGVRRALARWQPLAEAARPQHCGTLFLPKHDQQAMRLQAALVALQLPASWVDWVQPDQVQSRLGVRPKRAGVWFADGQLVRPDTLLPALLGQAGIQSVPAKVCGLVRQGHAWHVQYHLAAGQHAAVDPVFGQVVLANAAGVSGLLGTVQADTVLWPKLAQGRRVAGQVSHYPQGQSGPDVRAIMASEGYWLPAVGGWHTAGSTYWHDVARPVVSNMGHDEILQKIHGFLEGNDWQAQGPAQSGWAGWRAVVAGRLPVVGAIPGLAGLWTACALGSRGFTWASLAGDIIACALHNEPQILENDLLAAIRPR